MFIVPKIITKKQMKVVQAKDISYGRENVVMKNFREKGGAEILKNRKVYQRQFWNDLRESSLKRKSEGGDMGYTKKDLINFFAGKLNDHKDKFTSRQVRKIFTKVYGIKRAKVTRVAAEMRKDERLLENHQKMQERAVENQKNQEQFHSHINEIMSKGRENARADMHAASIAPIAHDKTRHADNYFGEKKNENSSQNNIVTSLETSNKNLRNAEQFLSHANPIQSINNSANTFGHLMFLKNRQHDYAGEQDMGVEDAKARLARIQGKADNYDKDNDQLDIAA